MKAFSKNELYYFSRFSRKIQNDELWVGHPSYYKYLYTHHHHHPLFSAQPKRMNSACRAIFINRFALRAPSSSSSSSVRVFTTTPHESLLRFDVMTGTWVVYSTSRKDRPHQTTTSSESAQSSRIRLSELPKIMPDCPFCAGNEHMTPPSVGGCSTVENPSSSKMRVVPNKYPAVAPLRMDQKHHHHMLPFLINDGVLSNNQVPAVGFHEVVIESPYHNAHMASSSSSSSATIMARDLLTVFRDRGLEHREYQDIEHSVFFKNHGSTAGASLIHPHSQIVSTRE